MKIAILEEILDTTVTCLKAHTGYDAGSEDAEVVKEAERLWSILELCKAQGLTDVSFQFTKGDDQ